MGGKIKITVIPIKIPIIINKIIDFHFLSINNKMKKIKDKKIKYIIQ